MHHTLRASQLRFEAGDPEHAEGHRRCALVDGSTGSVHMGLGLCQLDSGGRFDLHVHSFEESFYVLEGAPTLILDGRCIGLEPGVCGLVPIGTVHAWLGPETGSAEWVEIASPQPRAPDLPKDTFFLDGALDCEPAADLDVRDPRLPHFSRFDESDMQLDRLKKAVPIDAPTESASMATALLAYGGITVKRLVDQRLDAQLLTMFMVEYQPGGAAQLHDHTFEEAYLMLEGELETVADGEHYLLAPGDVFWTGVGCIHSFTNASGRSVRFLEVQAPQPPRRYPYRFNRDWDYLEARLDSEAQCAPRQIPS